MDRQAIREQIRATMPPEATDLSDTFINTIINQGVEEVAGAFHWAWLEASTTVTLAASTQTYALPADFNTAVALVDDDNDDTIEFLAPSKFFELVGNDTGNTSSNPEYWTIWEDNIYLSPIPDTADTNRLTFYYYKNPTTLATDGATPEWDNAFHWMLVDYGKWKLWERTGEHFEQAEQSRRTFVTYLSDMSAFYTARVKRAPFLYGDGIRGLTFGDINIPSLWRI